MPTLTTLILGSRDDEHAWHVHAELQNRGWDAEFLDSQSFPGELCMAYDPKRGRGHLRLPTGRRFEWTDIRSVYWRNYFGVGSPELPDAEQAWIAHNDARGLFESLLIQLPARWVNGWDAFWLHQTKPVQLARVKGLGIAIPPTVLTNDPEQVLAFAAEQPRAIIKPVQGGDHTARLADDHLSAETLERLRFAPITLQAEVPGTNVRVFVAGERVLACEVRTTAMDYRQDVEAQLLVHELPQEVAEDARRIARALHLLWTGIDFRLTPEGQYVFLEANPSPMFLGFEAQAGLPLTQALIELLVEG